MSVRSGRKQRRIPGVLAQRLSNCDLKQFVQAGLQAMGGHADRLLPAGKALATDSLNFDDAVPDSPTFDYLVGIKGSKEIVAALEVHPAQTSEVRRIVAKKDRTRNFLRGRGCVRCVVESWVWLPTSGVSIRTAIPARLLLAQNGIRWPVSQMDLASLIEKPR